MKDRYALGLDIGTVSVGWSVVNLDKNRIEDLGVRIFEKPENPKDGTSLALPRRTARSARRRLRRRRQRLNYLKDFFVQNSILDGNRIEYVLSPEHNHEFNPYQLRAKGLRQQLSPEELFVALYHIAKRRGYKSNRKVIEEESKEGDSRRVLAAIKANDVILSKYQSVGQALAEDGKFLAHKRNKRDDYTNSFIRQNFLDEITTILHTQQQFYPQLSDNSIHLLLEGDAKNGNKNGLFYQRPFMTHELINKMRGKCPLEKGEPRAPKASYDFEMFRLAQDLAHLKYTLNVDTSDIDPNSPEWLQRKQLQQKIKDAGGKLALTAEQIQACVTKCQQTRKVTYRAIREILGYKNDPTFNFDYIRGKAPKAEDLKKDPFAQEKNTFAELKFYHDVKKAAAASPSDWQRLEADHDLFNQLGEILTCDKTDEDILPKLHRLHLSDKTINQLMKLSYSGFGHLSIKAIRRITPELLKGNGTTYDKAMEAAGYHFAARLSGEKSKLPPLSKDEANQITNPVVRRAISQTIKVVNAVIHKHGLPYRIGLECANDLSRSFDDRRKIKQRQDENAANNQKIIERLKTEYHITNPTGLQIVKMQLYNEQDGKSPYSGDDISIDQLFSDDNYGQIDHIIPFSRCGNDSRANKVLCLNSENQEKGDRTPYEQWGGDPDRWKEIEAVVNANPKLNYKKKRILATTPPDEQWNKRAINDTRYISRFMSNYIKQHLDFQDNNGHRQTVILPAGGITTTLRKLWHIPAKDRDADCLHHSVDATIIALVDQGRIQKLQERARLIDRFGKKLERGWFADSIRQEMLDSITDHTTGEVSEADLKDLIQNFLPWPNFDKELRLRESQPKKNDTLAIWRDQFRDLYKDQDDEFRNSIHPIFVSRMPKRNGTGAVNKDTLRSPKTRDNDGKTRSVRMPLSKVALKELDNSVTKDTDPELYQQLKKRLEANGDDPQKAFAEPVYKSDKQFDKNGHPISPVSGIKVYSANPETSGFLINNGKTYVNNGSMVRVDIYKKANAKGKIEHFFVPVYANQIRKGRPDVKPTRILPTPKGFADVDGSFDFVCSLFPNDYVKFEFIKSGQSVVEEGYYSSYDVAGGTISLLPQTSASKDQKIRVSARPAIIANRLDIDVLGDNYPWK